MAQIPMGAFEQATVVPRVNRSSVDLSGSEAAGRAITQAGQAGMEIADQNLRLAQAQRQREQNEAEALARAKAANGVLDHELQTNAVVENIQAQMADGTLDWRNADKAYQEAVGKLEPAKVDGIDPVGNEHYQGGLKRNSEAGRLRVHTLVQGARRTEFKTQFDTGLDTLGKLAGQPGADIDKINAQAEGFAPLARAAGVDSATIAEKIQTFKDRNWTNQATNRLIGARGDMKSLDALEHDLSAEDGYYAGKLDTDRRNALLSQLTSEKTRLENAQRAQADKREAAAARALNQMEAQLATGIPAPVEQRLAWLETVKGTTAEVQAGQYIEIEKQSQELLKMPPAQQRAFLQRMQSEQATNGATVDQQRIFNGLKQASDARIAMLRTQPLQHYAVTTGATVPPLDIQALASGDVAKVQTQIAERMTILAAQRKQYGAEAGTQPLLPQEATLLAAQVKQMGIDNTLKLYGTLSTAIGDPQGYRAAIQQISPDAPVRGVAGMIYAKQRQATLQAPGLFSGAKMAASGDIARTLLRGEAILNPGAADKKQDGKPTAFPMPPPKQIADAFSTAVGTAFSGHPDAYELGLQAVRAYYAGKASEAGDVTGELDTKLVEEAVNATLGMPTKVNGQTVIAPWGMDGDTFKDKLNSAWERWAKFLHGRSPDLDDYTLEAAGDGYRVIDANGLYVPITEGVPLVLKVQ